MEPSSHCIDPLLSHPHELGMGNARLLCGNLALGKQVPVQGSVAVVGCAREVISSIVVLQMTHEMLGVVAGILDVLAQRRGILPLERKEGWSCYPDGGWAGGPRSHMCMAS